MKRYLSDESPTPSIHTLQEHGSVTNIPDLQFQKSVSGTAVGSWKRVLLWDSLKVQQETPIHEWLQDLKAHNNKPGSFFLFILFSCSYWQEVSTDHFFPFCFSFFFFSPWTFRQYKGEPCMLFSHSIWVEETDHTHSKKPVIKTYK